MNKPLSADELAILATPAILAVPVMTRREKLMRFASLVRASPAARLYMFSNLEHMHPSELTGLRHPVSAFALAAADGIFKDAGLASDTVLDAQKFFELTRAELHEFSCDCGGQITNRDMADRIERIAARSA